MKARRNVREVADYLLFIAGAMPLLWVHQMLYLMNVETVRDLGMLLFEAPCRWQGVGVMVEGIDERWTGSRGRKRRRRMVRRSRALTRRCTRWALRAKRPGNVPGGWSMVDWQAQSKGLQVARDRHRAPSSFSPSSSFFSS